MSDVRSASVKQLAYKIKGYGKQPRFAFFLGAGASRDSRIITAGEMIREFKKQILTECCPENLKTDGEQEDWLKGRDWYGKSDSEYCMFFEQVEPKEIGRQRYIESLIEGKEPSFGYVVLANLMASNYINTIITTNFDDLVYSACTTYTGIRPIVYAYGVLASEMRITAQRPKILKMHGDYLYSTLKNTRNETATQDPNMERQLMQVLNEYGLVVLGYSGGDNSVMKVLSNISSRNDLYWCVMRGESPGDAVKKLLADKGGFLVEIEGFDKTMNEIRRIVGFDVQQMVGSIQQRQTQMIESFKLFEPSYSADLLGEIVEAVKVQPAEGMENKTVQSADFFSQALKAQNAGQLKEAEALYRKAIEIDPYYASAYNNLGIVISEDKTRYAEAEEAYRKALELNPREAAVYNNLGFLLYDKLRRNAEAEELLRKSIELDPSYATAYNNLGNVIHLDTERGVEAEAHYRRAIELDPAYAHAYYNLGNLLLKDPARHAEAETYYRKAVTLDPTDSRAWYNLACLESLQGKTDAAIEDLRRAAQVKPFDREFARRDPDLKPISHDPRFKEIVGSEET